MLRKKGNLIESWSYTAFGEQQGSTRSPWTFSSKRFDPFTSHLAFGQRDYDPTIGRWTTPDPLGFEAGPNLYTYVFNQPLTKRDPLGLYALPSLGMWDSMLIEKNAANMNSPRFQGGMRAMGGLVEGGIGAGLFALPTFGISQFAGSLMMAHGFDNFQSGLRQTFAGSYQEPATIPFLKSFGLSHETAHLAHEGFGISTTIGGGMQLGIQRAAFQSISQLPSRHLGVAEFSNGMQKSFANNPLTETRYTGKVLDQMRLNAQTATPDFHAFPRIVDNYAAFGRQEIIIGGDRAARLKVSLPGSYQSRDGLFEWIIESNKTVNHRLFVPKQP